MNVDRMVDFMEVVVYASWMVVDLIKVAIYAIYLSSDSFIAVEVRQYVST